MSEKDTNDQQQRIDELLDVKAGCFTAGICGREWCELCGELGSFTGFICALATHTAGGRYVCGSCCTRSEDGTSIRGASSRELDNLILERGYRYCSGCGREVILEERTVEEAQRQPFTCPACQGLDRGRAGRRRYLEHEATKKGGLEQAAARIHWAKAGIESILAESE